MVNEDQRELDYSVYAGNLFDLTNQENDAYWELVRHAQDWFSTLSYEQPPAVLDVGAGTGNFILGLAEVLPLGAKFVHLDMSAEMNSAAKDKYEDRSLEVEIVESFVQSADFESGTFDSIISINALNTAPPQALTLKLMHQWLRPGGWLYLVDFGRPQDTLSWARYLVGNSLKRNGPLETARLFAKCFGSFGQNRRARVDQESGNMWLHTAEDLSTMIESSGFEIVDVEVCYRGYSDRVIAKAL